MEDNIFKSMQWMQNLNKTLGINSNVTDVLTKQRLQVIAVTAPFSEAVKYESVFNAFNTPVVNAFRKAMAFQPRFIMPQAAVSSFLVTGSKYSEIFQKTRGIVTALNAIRPEILSQINSFQSAISHIRGQVAAIAIARKELDLLDSFEEVTEQALTLNERIIDDNSTENEALSEIKQMLQGVIIKIEKTDKKISTRLLNLLTILAFILSMISEVRNWFPKPEYATKQEIQAIIQQQFSWYQQKLKEENQTRILKVGSKIMLKPKARSLVIEKLVAGSEVTILQVLHQWAFVSYVSPEDNIFHAGWVLKKYLSKP